MAKTFDILDPNVSIQTVSELFKLVNVELEAQEGNDDVSLCRFEFWELCARIAEIKYIKPAIEEDLGTAFERFMREHILIQYDQLPQMQWNRWRLDHYHKFSVTNLIEANFDILKRYYAKMCGGGIMQRDACIHLFTVNEEIELPYKLA